MKHLKTYKIFESSDSVKKMVEDLLRDFSDNDIPVDVDIQRPYPNWGGEIEVDIFIGKDIDWSLYHHRELTETASDLPLYDNIHNLNEINDYLVGEGYHLENISLITNSESDNRIKRLTCYEFSDLIKNIKDIQEGNNQFDKLSKERPSEDWGSFPFGIDFKIENEDGVKLGSWGEFPKKIRLVGIYYTNKSK